MIYYRGRHLLWRRYSILRMWEFSSNIISCVIQSGSHTGFSIKHSVTLPHNRHIYLPISHVIMNAGLLTGWGNTKRIHANHSISTMVVDWMRDCQSLTGTLYYDKYSSSLDTGMISSDSLCSTEKVVVEITTYIKIVYFHILKNAMLLSLCIIFNSDSFIKDLRYNTMVVWMRNVPYGLWNLDIWLLAMFRKT